MANPSGANQVLTKIYRAISNAIRVYIVNPEDISGDGTVTNPTVVNQSVVTANVEESYTFPAGTKRFILRSRSKGNMKVSYTLGDSSVNYMTVYAGNYYEELNIDFGDTIYFQTDKSSDTIEILSWQ